MTVVDTPRGPARVLTDSASPASATLVLGHGAGGGAGGGAGSRDLVALSEALPASGVTVVRVEQPWRVVGRRVASAPRVLDEAWVAVLAALREAGDLTGRVVVGGRSAGARVACRTARVTRADAVVALAFPLHPPGRPERSRHEELVAAGVPTLVVQGERDPFGRPEEFPGGPYDLTVVPGADHGFAVPRGGPPTQDQALALIVRCVRGFLAAG